jgi:hypothetical protein
MATINDAYNSIADLNFWFKNRAGDDLMLSDIPSIIPLRWTFIKDNWEFMKPQLLSKMNSYSNPDFLKKQIDDFSDFIDTQRNINKINPFQDINIFHKFYAVFDNISITSTDLTNEEIKIIQIQTNRVTAFSKNDFLKIRANITDYRDRVADVINLTDSTYNSIIGRSPIPAQVSATIVDANYLLNLQGSIKSVDFILSNLFAVEATVDPFALARANANNPDIDIGQYQSGNLVKINYGEDLESLAARYLNDSNKWIDIAIANGLKPPYIDEIGQSISLLANGNGNQINIASVSLDGSLNINKLYINQPIFLSSNIQLLPDQRTITNIRQVPISGEIILELDGASDLSIYKTIDGASIRVFTPSTINSSFYVLIPSPNPLPNNRVDEVPWFLAKSAQDEKRAKVDLAVDDKGELNFTTNSDLMLSYGLDNAIQAIKLKIITELGSLRYHRKFGLVNVVGEKNLDVDNIRKAITNSITTQVQIDGRFDRVESLVVSYLTNKTTNQGVAAIVISMSVRLAGGTTAIPIGFTINNL